MSRPQQIADMIRDATAGWEPPENAAEAYELLQALAYLAEAVGLSLHDLGEAVHEHANLKPVIHEAIHEAGDGVGAVADQLRDIPPPPPEERRDERGQAVPDWVTPWHLTEEHPVRPLPGRLPAEMTADPPRWAQHEPGPGQAARSGPGHHPVLVPAWWGLNGPRPPEPSPRQQRKAERQRRKRARRAYKAALRKQREAEWLQSQRNR